MYMYLSGYTFLMDTQVKAIDIYDKMLANYMISIIIGNVGISDG